MIYLINNDIEFLYDEGLLTSRSLSKNIKLLAPSTKILKYLLDKKGALVTQQELFKIGWGEKEKYVTSNAFYQNILLIRKAFEDLELNEDFIKTVPKKGYLININVQIEYVELTNLETADVNHEVSEKEKTIDFHEQVKPRELPGKISNYKKYSYIFPLVISLMVIIFYFFVVKITDNKKELYNYNRCGMLDGREIYCNLDNYYDGYHMSLINNEISNLDKKYKVIYLKSYKYINDFSFLVCTNEFSRFRLSPNNCVSYYMKGGSHNEKE